MTCIDLKCGDTHLSYTYEEWVILKKTLTEAVLAHLDVHFALECYEEGTIEWSHAKDIKESGDVADVVIALRFFGMHGLHTFLEKRAIKVDYFSLGEALDVVELIRQVYPFVPARHFKIVHELHNLCEKCVKEKKVIELY